MWTHLCCLAWHLQQTCKWILPNFPSLWQGPDLILGKLSSQLTLSHHASPDGLIIKHHSIKTHLFMPKFHAMMNASQTWSQKRSIRQNIEPNEAGIQFPPCKIWLNRSWSTFVSAQAIAEPTLKGHCKKMVLKPGSLRAANIPSSLKHRRTKEAGPSYYCFCCWNLW